MIECQEGGRKDVYEVHMYGVVHLCLLKTGQVRIDEPVTKGWGVSSTLRCIVLVYNCIRFSQLLKWTTRGWSNRKKKRCFEDETKRSKQDTRN